jgi:hypothetical protein
MRACEPAHNCARACARAWSHCPLSARLYTPAGAAAVATSHIARHTSVTCTVFMRTSPSHSTCGWHSDAQRCAFARGTRAAAPSVKGVLCKVPHYTHERMHTTIHTYTHTHTHTNSSLSLCSLSRFALSLALLSLSLCSLSLSLSLALSLSRSCSLSLSLSLSLSRSLSL